MYADLTNTLIVIPLMKPNSKMSLVLEQSPETQINSIAYVIYTKLKLDLFRQGIFGLLTFQISKLSKKGYDTIKTVALCWFRRTTKFICLILFAFQVCIRFRHPNYELPFPFVCKFNCCTEIKSFLCSSIHLHGVL